MPIAAPPGMVRTINGRILPASKSFGQANPKPKKFLVCLGYYFGDIDAAEELASLIADLERTRNRDADFLIFRRADTREMSLSTRDKLAAKFDNLIYHVCRRTDGRGHPAGCNSMWYDLIAFMAEKPQLDAYYAFINLESDATPTRPGWIGELIAEWKDAAAGGLAVIGQRQTRPNNHINGVAVYASDILKRGGKVLNGGSMQVPFDIRHGPTLLPMARDTPLIHFEFRKPTITPEELFEAKRGVAPAIWHGVKDTSARAIVRATHVAMRAPATEVQNQIVELITNDVRAELASTPPPPKHEDLVKRPNVYTYVERTNSLNNTERQQILDLWRQGWASRGWNPVILSFKDAVKHELFPDFEAALSKLPCVGNRAERDQRMYRWLALDSAHGGLLVEFDALPNGLTPESVDGENAILRSMWDGLIGAHLNGAASFECVDSIMKYDAQPEDVVDGKPNVSDTTIIEKIGIPNAAYANEVTQFNDKRVGADKKSVAMARFLAGK